MKIKSINEVRTLRGEEVQKVVELLNHGESVERIAEVEGFDPAMVATLNELRLAGCVNNGQVQVH